MKKVDCLFWGGLLLATLAMAVGPAYAGTAGDLDNAFGTGGIAVTRNVAADGIVNSILLQSDGDVLVFAGGTTVLRYTTTGRLDPAFGSKGIVSLATSVSGSLAIQPNGQIVIAGVVTPSTGGAELGAERLNSDGTLDTSFGSGGLAVVSLGIRSPSGETAVLVYPNGVPNAGDILVCTGLFPTGRREPSQTALARFTSDGALDPTFGSQGLSIQTGDNGCTALELLSDGDFLVVNGQAVAQYSPSGSVRPGVSGGTVVAASQSNPTFSTSTLQPNGDYLLGVDVFTGEESRGHDSAIQVLRFTKTGSSDPAFNNAPFHFVEPGGSNIEALVDDVAVGPNGDIVVVGDQIHFAQSPTIVDGLARLTPTGSLDPTFGKEGRVVNNVQANSKVVVQPDGNIVTAGFASDNTTLRLARYLGH
jgi:uncharacterized delta-60 repeat protein